MIAGQTTTLVQVAVGRRCRAGPSGFPEAGAMLNQEVRSMFMSHVRCAAAFADWAGKQLTSRLVEEFRAEAADNCASSRVFCRRSCYS